MLGNDSDEAFQTAQDCAVDDHRTRGGLVYVVVRAAVLEVEALWQLEVELDRGALEGSAESVADGDVDLGAVERAVTRVELPLSGILLVKSCAKLLVG